MEDFMAIDINHHLVCDCLYIVNPKELGFNF